MNLFEINEMLRDVRRKSIKLASALLSALISYGWDKDGRWLMPSSEFHPRRVQLLGTLSRWDPGRRWAAYNRPDILKDRKLHG